MARRFLVPVELPGNASADLYAVPKQQLDAGLAAKAASGHSHTAGDVGAVPTSRTITAGTALTGGGDLSANRTLAVDLGTGSTQAAAGNHNHDAAYAGTGHTHSPDLVPFAVQTLASSTTLTMNASLGKHFRCTALATNTTVADPTNKTDGQPLILEVAAQTSTRTISLNAAIVNCSGVTFPLSLAANKRWFGGFLISGTTAYLLSSAVQP